MRIIVTGASRGIGFETVKVLADMGHNVIGTARSKDKLEELRNIDPDHIEICPADLSRSEEVDTLADFICDRMERVDILVNNAGALVNKPFEELTMDDWVKMMEVNLFSAIRLIRTLLPRMESPAHIVNISSMGGYPGSAKFPGLSAYSVSKGALCTLTECLAAEFADRDIAVNTLCLGAVQTEMLEEAFPGFEAPVDADQMGSYIADFALNGSSFYHGKVLPVSLADPG